MRTARLTAEMQRWLFALLAAPSGEVTYAGVAESPDGKADTLEMKDARGQPFACSSISRPTCR